MTPERCVIEIDWSMLELRLGAQVAQCSAMIEEFSKGLKADLHWKTAAMIYGHPLEWQGLVDPIVQKRDRTKAKPCVVGSTLVITNNGVKPITEIQLTDKLYDGIEWVTHEGLLNQGLKETIEYGGFRGTPDHIIFTNKGQVPLGYLESGIVDAMFARDVDSGAYIKFKHSCEFTRFYTGETAIYESKKLLLKALFLEWQSSQATWFNITTNNQNQYVLKILRRTEKQYFEYHRPMTRIEFLDYIEGCLSHLTECEETGLWLVGIGQGRLPRLKFDPKYNTTVNFSEYVFKANSTQMTEMEFVFDIANAGPRHRFTICNDIQYTTALIANCNFGLLYGMQPKNFQINLRKDNLFWSLEECKFAHTRFFESYPEMATMHKYWKDSLIKAYVDNTPFLEVRTLCGRRKLIDIKQKIREGKIGKKIDKYGKMYHYAFANDIVNFPIQGTGADMAKKAMIEGQRLLNKYNLDCQFMLQLHDAFYLDCAVKDAKTVIELIGKCAMIDHVQHYCPDVPLSTSVEVGSSMGNSLHYCDFISQK